MEYVSRPAGVNGFTPRKSEATFVAVRKMKGNWKEEGGPGCFVSGGACGGGEMARGGASRHFNAGDGMEDQLQELKKRKGVRSRPAAEEVEQQAHVLDLRESGNKAHVYLPRKIAGCAPARHHLVGPGAVFPGSRRCARRANSGTLPPFGGVPSPSLRRLTAGPLALALPARRSLRDRAYQARARLEAARGHVCVT